jgi:hypothetical protein
MRGGARGCDDRRGRRRRRTGQPPDQARSGRSGTLGSSPRNEEPMRRCATNANRRRRNPPVGSFRRHRTRLTRRTYRIRRASQHRWRKWATLAPVRQSPKKVAERSRSRRSRSVERAKNRCMCCGCGKRRSVEDPIPVRRSGVGSDGRAGGGGVNTGADRGDGGQGSGARGATGCAVDNSPNRMGHSPDGAQDCPGRRHLR